MKYRRFSLLLFLLLGVFVLVNLLIWEVATKDILTRTGNQVTGDMSRMGYLPHLNHYRINENNLTKKHLNHTQYNDNIDMITIGDSFSNGMAGGLNPFYQDHIASDTNLNILNINQFPSTRNYIETIAMLSNSGELKKNNVKYILIESTQRKIVSRFLSPINFNVIFKKENILKDSFSKVNNNLRLPKIGFINNGNFKYLTYSILYNFSPNAFISKVYKLKLDRTLFSIGAGNDLLFYKSDLKAISKNTKNNLEIVNRNLNFLANLLKKDNIQLVFLPAVTKYDLYREYIKNKKDYPEDPFFNIFRKLNKSYLFIDTKDILLKELKKGTKDIFYIDDTHWSYRASDIISKEIKHRLGL